MDISEILREYRCLSLVPKQLLEDNGYILCLDNKGNITLKETAKIQEFADHASAILKKYAGYIYAGDYAYLVAVQNMHESVELSEKALNFIASRA